MTAFEAETLSILNTLQIPQHMKGFKLITTSMDLINSNPMYIQKMIKLYTKTGEIHNCSPRTVEGNIYHALQCAKTDFHVQKDVLGTNYELGSAEFLATLHRVIVIRLADKENECLR